MGRASDMLGGSSVVRQIRGVLFSVWVVPLLYVSVLLAVYLRYGLVLQLTLGLIAVAVLPVVSLVAKSKDFLKNTTLLVSVLLTYEALQGITGAVVNSHNAASLAGLDESLLGMDLPATVQKMFASNTVTMIATFFYSLHFFLILGAIVLFWFTSRTNYSKYAYSMVLTSYLALMTFVLYPSAPPWFVGSALNLLSSGTKLLPSSLQTLQSAALVIESDKFAAFPSLHVAYAALFAIYSIRINRKFALFSIPILLGVGFSVLYLGQHYFVDILGGLAYSGGSVLVVDRLYAKFRPSPPTPAAAAP